MYILVIVWFLITGLNYDEKQIQQITQQVKEQQEKVDQLKSSFVDKLRGKVSDLSHTITWLLRK